MAASQPDGGPKTEDRFVVGFAHDRRPETEDGGQFLAMTRSYVSAKAEFILTLRAAKGKDPA